MKEMTAIVYILYMEEIVKVSLSLFQHDGTAAFILSESSPVQLALSPKDLLGEQIQILTICRIIIFNCHTVKGDE